jgi:hypothetical protein
MWLRENDYVVYGEIFIEDSNIDKIKENYKNGEGSLYKVLFYFFDNWKLKKSNYGSKCYNGYYYSNSWSYDGFAKKSIIKTKEPLDELYKKYLNLLKISNWEL